MKKLLNSKSVRNQEGGFREDADFICYGFILADVPTRLITTFFHERKLVASNSKKTSFNAFPHVSGSLKEAIYNDLAYIKYTTKNWAKGYGYVLKGDPDFDPETNPYTIFLFLFRILGCAKKKENSY